MRILRLEWAGLRLATPYCTLYVDAIAAPGPRMGPALRDRGARLLVPPPPDTAHALALVTHVHDDHYDPPFLRRMLGEGGMVVCPPSMSDRVARDGFVPCALHPWATLDVFGVHVRALPAVDGVGDDQISFAVRSRATTLLHAGDTLWHGHWWRIARELPRVDVAFLPVNGAQLQVPGERASGVESVMTPEQAVGAARVLGAGALCPIHYDLFERAPYYVQAPDVVPRLRRAASAAGVHLTLCAPGEWWERERSSAPDAA